MCNEIYTPTAREESRDGGVDALQTYGPKVWNLLW